MTIGYILDDTLDRADGVQQAVLTIGEYLRSEGHDVHYIVAETTRTDIENIHSVGSFWHLRFNGNSVRTPKPASKKRIKKLFSDIAFDVLHVQMPFSPLLAGRVLDYAPQDIPVFGTFHILPYNQAASFGTNVLGKLQSKRVANFTQLFAVSEPARIFMENAYGCHGTVLPNPVNWSFFHAYHRPANVKISDIVFVGRFEERKGVRELVRAYAGLPTELQNQTRLIMCGKGPLHEEIRQLATELDVSVDLPGFVSEEQKAMYLSGARIAVFPSISGESFGIVLVEAMSSGSRVTLGGNNPGYSSVMSGWPEALFDPTDQKQFSAILQKFLTDDKLAGLIGAQQHHAAKSYDVAEVSGILLQTYTEALQNQNSHS